MFLRASEPNADLAGAISVDSGGGANIPHGEELRRFALAVLAGENEVISTARKALVNALGPKGLVDAAAVVAMFNAINRIADATGTIEPDTPYSATTPLVDRYFEVKGLLGNR